MYLLDTCAISELVAKLPNRNVIEWFEHQAEDTLFLSIYTVAEVKKGIYLLPPSKKRTDLQIWLQDDILNRFQGRILYFDDKTADVWARMIADLKDRGLLRSPFDSLIEATALANNLIIVTRNERNFIDSSVSVLNIWNK